MPQITLNRKFETNERLNHKHLARTQVPEEQNLLAH